MKRVLVANRGEIAVRIIRACREEGLQAVAVYSDADRHSLHVRMADEAVRLGPAPAAESYLHIERIIEAARRSGADAVHPGYGFLAERAEFAEAVEDAGLIFIGPPAAAIRAMGEKTEARRRMVAAGVPVVPGSTAVVAAAGEALEEARRIGFPILLKAAAGGGGKGMRRVNSEGELPAAFRQASSEAAKAFGDGSLYVEKLIEGPRHVEIQVFADRYGNTVHLGERECSIQRRHQKLIEESPSPAVNSELRARMGEAAVRAAQAVGYVNAGTVEFLLDREGRFYFLEMNTRIQVEHPVTELVYGVDLVREQLRVARGDRLSIPQGLSPRGHAIECRITAEDPFQGFLPATGLIAFLSVPSGPGVRWDGGFEAGSEIGLFYDSLLAKLVVWGENRSAAIRRMARALEELVVVGVPTSQPFHLRVMRDPGFASGQYDIEYMETTGMELLRRRPADSELDLAAVAAALAEEAERVKPQPGAAGQGDRRESVWLRAARLEGVQWFG
ncbi:MAG: acetyl-CoA carboxylase biotin carboxylase subunit [Gemmatimonadales bacterium]|nr:Biotin carboxylase [bacterium HR33]GIW50799.1 MAG: acetyl-CoA carboxylase biotin carboxylase subunit [Gemmatimonadales bacterium]